MHAVGGGAVSSTTVDMSHTYLDWARRNLALNGLAGPAHEFVQADCLTGSTMRLNNAGPRQYDLIFIDPPTHSRSKRMQQEFDVQRDHAWLLQTAGRLLAPGGVMLFSNNFQRFKLDTGALEPFLVEDITRATIPEDYARNQKIHVCYLLRRAPGAQRGYQQQALIHQAGDFFVKRTRYLAALAFLAMISRARHRRSTGRQRAGQ